MPQRFLDPLFAYIEGAVPASPGVLLVQAAAAAAAAKWGNLEETLRILCVAMILDLAVGVGAALRRKQFSLRALWDGLVAKMMVVMLCVSVAWMGQYVPGALWLSKLLNSGFAIIDLGSVVRNFRRARVKLPPWVERLVERVEAALTAEVESRARVPGVGNDNERSPQSVRRG